MKLDELEVNSPEWEAEVNRLQDEEDAQRNAPTAAAEGEKVEAETGDKPVDAKPETPEPEAKSEPTTDDPEKPSDTSPPAGVASKDGKHVLPYAALKGARDETRAERTARAAAEAERDSLKQQLEDLKAGKKTDSSVDELSQADLDAIAEDFPALAKVAQAAKTAQAELADLKAKTAAAPAAKEAEPTDDPVQDAIDSVPMLAEWQAVDATKFARAVQHDKVLQDSPKWKGKPLAERFAHATRQAAAEFDIEIQDTKPQSTPKGQSKPEPEDRAKPEDRISAAERTAPNTLSDFKGGAPDKGGGIDKLSPAQQLNALNNMSKAAYDAYLAKL